MARHPLVPYPPYADTELRACGIYAITNSVTQQMYIGQTRKSFRERWNMHRGSLQRGNHPNKALQVDWNAYGSDIFQFRILEAITRNYRGWVDGVRLKHQEYVYVTMAGVQLYNAQNTLPKLYPPPAMATPDQEA